MVSRVFRPPPLGDIRLASIEETSAIFELINESMAKNFRIKVTSDLVYLIETAVLSICQLDVNGSLVGFICVKDYPLIPSVHPAAWEEYVWTKYKAIELNSRNTLFLHLMCWNPVYSRDIVDNMMKSIFMHDPYVHHIAMVKSLIAYPLLVPGQFRAESSFRRVQAMEKGVPGDQLPTLCIADRKEVSPRLRIRRAVEEDNDDIVPIVERHSARLRQLYGDFYVSELISRHPESERVLLVCEHKELAVGVMCLNTQINYDELEESFELSPFAGLKHLEASPAKHSKDIESAMSVSACNIPNFGESSPTGQVMTPEILKSRDLKSRVTWLFEEDEFKDLKERSEGGRTVSHLGPAQLDVLNLLEDEDELEFDIVNIDTNLLRVPEMLSYDTLGRGPADNILKILDGLHKESVLDDKSKKDKIRKSVNASLSSMSITKPPEPIHYTGTPNAFLLELFAMHPDYNERYGFDMLEAAYELFPNRDYCVMCLPSSQPSFPLLEHFTLVTPYSTRLRFVNETLYVAHVNSVRGDIRVRPGEACDIEDLSHIMEHVPRAPALLDLFESSLTSCSLSSYVLLSQNQPIGMVVLGPLEGGTAIRTQYDLEPEPRRPGTDGTIVAGIMSPALEPHGRWYMRDLLRQSRYTTLFWISRLFAKGDTSPSRNLMSLAGHMTPVKPRRTVPNITGNRDLDEIYKDVSSPFALWVLERPLTSLPKVFVNNSIVVVGASRTGLAFLETLLMGPTSQYLTFSNVTLVSEHGLPTVTECLRAADICVPREGRYTDRYIKSVPFYFYLDVMSAVMTHIDRKKKCIHLKGGGTKYYDELVLTCGQQFQHPDYLNDSLELVKEFEKGKPCERILMDDPKYQPDRVCLPPELPENVILINSLFEANLYLRKLLRMITDAKETEYTLCEENPVVVYGECLEAYSCIAALWELGLSPKMIVFVEPFPPDDPKALRVNCFNNETVDERVQVSIEKLGVRVLRQCKLELWRQRGNRVVGLHFMSPLQAIYTPCFALFYYGMKAIDIHAFKAINECGLVYDGGLVVGPTFETNDPHIFGAGTCVRYSRRLYSSRRLHKYYCSEDVGEALARLFLRKVDPFVMADSNVDAVPSELIPRYSSSLLTFKSSHGSLQLSATRVSLAHNNARRWQPVMKFESPIAISATFPGPLHYLKLRKPGPEIPMEVQMCLPHQGHTFITDKRGNYFRLHLNALHCVEGLTCLSKKIFSPEILSQLYGKHEAFFNKLLIREKMNQIDDLFEFFTQPWMSALYQETFDHLLDDINQQDVGTVYDLVKSRFTLFDEDKKVEDTQPSAMQFASCTGVPSCGFGPSEARNLGTFRSVIDKFVARTSSTQVVAGLGTFISMLTDFYSGKELVKTTRSTDIPSECGQSDQIRGQAAGFWKAVGGERIVIAHIARYLNRNSVTNPHYASPKHGYF